MPPGRTAKRTPPPAGVHVPDGTEALGISSRNRARWQRGLESRAPASSSESSGGRRRRPLRPNGATTTTDATSATHGTTAIPKQGEIEHFKTRFSAIRIINVVQKLSNERKKWIDDSGFGVLLSLPEFHVPIKLVKWIMSHMNPLLSEFRFHGKVIVFNKSLVCKILGIPSSDTPVKMPGNAKDVAGLWDSYREGERTKIKKCIDVLINSNDKDSFMRAFIILALGTVFCSGTANIVSLKYLHSLVDMSKLKEYDWATHIIETLMVEVSKYHKFSTETLEKDHQIGACLPILAIAYMDHLDIPMDRATHKINNDAPRICNITYSDFEFVMAIDKSRLALNCYGKLPFCDFSSTPYYDAPSREDDNVVCLASLGDWV